jgi:hypothetical protein
LIHFDTKSTLKSNHNHTSKQACRKRHTNSYTLPLVTSVIKLGPARQVDLGPGRPGGWTGPDLLKDRPGQQPDQTRATRRSTHDPGEPGRDPFFFQMWDLKPISIYTLCSQEKSHVFSTWDKKIFGLNTST